ncbi:hypothetical protein JTB14_026846 [Gonioctena quinquepunctata]|nr:hypothetical protein JTB14_026846 [Gonioctena quinquepunctata]
MDDDNLETDVQKTTNQVNDIEKPSDVPRQKTFEQRFYKNTDIGPFLVMIEAKEETVQVGRYDHLKIATEIVDPQLRDIKKVKIKGINKLGIQFCTPESANKFVNNESLKNRGYIMYIPQNCVTCKGIIRNVSKYLSIDRIKAVTQSPFQILDAKRLNRRVVKEDKTVEYVTTSTLLVTFEGVILPRYVTMSYLSMPVIPYIQPVMQCFSCLEFGHTERQCRSTNSKCHNCSTAHESEVICTKKCEFCHSSEHNYTKNVPNTKDKKRSNA